ncbi:MAG TPA: hypothetical protein PKC36_08015 [Dietzia sp.]|nr:hypothetical protein [Dietzia sp.]
MVVSASVADPATPGLSDLGTADRVAELRRRLAAMPGGGPPAATRSGAPVEAVPAGPAAPGAAPAVPGVAVPRAVASLLPGGVLPAGHVTVVSGGAGLRVGLLAAATAAGARCAVVGWPELGVAAVAEQGGRLDCLALVPDAGPDPAAVVSVLLDGLDLVLLGPAVAAVPPSRARVVAGRVRAAGAVLLVGPGWPGAELVLAGRHCRYGGLGTGAGRLASVSTTVRCSGRAAPSRTAEWVAAG